MSPTDDDQSDLSRRSDSQSPDDLGHKRDSVAGDGAEARQRGDDDSLQELRDILLRKDEGYLTDAVSGILDEALARRIEGSKEQMAAALAPIMGQAIRHQVREAQDDIIDALYPVIGKTIQRSVAEAMRALAHRVDESLRTTFSIRRLGRRLKARLRGIPESDLLLREALPFRIQEVFLIHRESGLLLEHLSAAPARAQADAGVDGYRLGRRRRTAGGQEADRDLVSSMLTAIRDFVQDAFGTGQEGGLDEIQYGELRVLIEPGRWAYLAVVVEGIEPEDYRHEMRSALSNIHGTYGQVLREYEGEPSRLAGIDRELLPLLIRPREEAKPSEGKRPPWLAIGATAAVLVLCLTAACFGAWQLTWGRSTLRPTRPATADSIPMMPSATPSATVLPQAVTPTGGQMGRVLPSEPATSLPSTTATQTLPPLPTSTPSSSPTASHTPTAIPSLTPAPYLGVMIGNVYLRVEARNDSPLTGETVNTGRPVEIMAIQGTWYLICWPPRTDGVRCDATGTSGWVPGRWVGVVSAPPAAIITPGP